MDGTSPPCSASNSISTFLSHGGGFYLPAVQQGQRDRWVLSVIVHQGLQHILSNMLLYIVLARHLERRYGTWRLVVVSTISGIGGNLFCCLFSDPCTVVVGASGLIFGVAAFWIADLLLHLHEIRGILLQLFLILVFFVLFLVTIITQPHVSHFSHLGGLLAGLFPSMLFLPSSGGRLPDTVIIAVGLTCTVMFNAILFPCGVPHQAAEKLRVLDPFGGGHVRDVQGTEYARLVRTGNLHAVVLPDE